MYHLISMAMYDDKDRFEFQCVSDSAVNESLQLHEAPVKVRCGQGHTDDVLETRSNEVLAKLIFCRPDHAHRYRLNLTARANRDIPPRLYLRTHEQAAHPIIANGILPGGGAGGKKSKRNSFFSIVPLGNQTAVSGVRADRPKELCFSTAEVIEAGVDLFLTNSKGGDHQPSCAQYVYSIRKQSPRKCGARSVLNPRQSILQRLSRASSRRKSTSSPVTSPIRPMLLGQMRRLLRSVQFRAAQSRRRRWRRQAVQ